MIHVKIGQKVVFKTNNMKEALKVVADIFRKGHDDVWDLDGFSLDRQSITVGAQELAKNVRGKAKVYFSEEIP